MTYGMTLTGFTPARLEDLLAKVRADIAEAEHLGKNVNTEARSPLGQLVEIFCGALAEAWEHAELVWMAHQLFSSQGVQLIELAALRGINGRLPATSTTVAVTLGGTPATVIAASSEVELDDTGSRWATQAEVTIGGGGTVAAVLVAVEAGPIQVLADSDWTIKTPVSGWATVSNTVDGEPGRAEETDSELRLRVLSQVFAPGSSPDGIVVALRKVEGVTHARVIENSTDTTDGDGRPAHSIECVVQGGDDQAVAEAIWQYAAGGIATVSTVSSPTTKTVVDANGDNQTVKLSRPELKAVYVEIDYTPKTGFPTDGEARMSQAILDFGSGLEPGKGVDPVDIERVVLCALPSQTLSSLTLRMGLSASPATAVQVPAGKTELADFDSSRITITKV